MHPLVMILVIVGVVVFAFYIWGKINKSAKVDTMIESIEAKPTTSTKGIIREAEVALNQVAKQMEKKKKQIDNFQKEVATMQEFKGEKGEEPKDTQE